ncbi:MAG: hypothetical protein H6858_06235 [Rhodospirillales bacterium]|nr:hypothetical protein [Alphaproteobacteria bacterium]MCB1839985.1 hypothetical protein [Alphaproteobacteria bacterium]MCB9977176.1 hypothetical protein [Rhodospirillales bacterium]
MQRGLMRVSMMIRRDQHDELQKMGVNISGYIRDLIDDRLSNNVIIINVGEDTKKIYDQIISHSGEHDRELEPFLRDALKNMLTEKIKQMQQLQKNFKV